MACSASLARVTMLAVVTPVACPRRVSSVRVRINAYHNRTPLIYLSPTVV